MRPRRALGGVGSCLVEVEVLGVQEEHMEVQSLLLEQHQAQESSPWVQVGGWFLAVSHKLTITCLGRHTGRAP